MKTSEKVKEISDTLIEIIKSQGEKAVIKSEAIMVMIQWLHTLEASVQDLEFTIKSLKEKK